MQATLKMQISDPDAIKGYQVLTFIGEFDKIGYSEINDQLEKIVEDLHVPTLIFDFHELKFINSEGIGYLMEVHSRLMKADKQLVIVGSRDHIKDVFDAIGIAEIITTFDKLSDFKAV